MLFTFGIFHHLVVNMVLSYIFMETDLEMWQYGIISYVCFVFLC